MDVVLVNLIKYQAFIRVVELGNVTKAAQDLGYSQPGISHMLDSLESELGFPLLIRGKDCVRPTPEGEKILYYCRQIVKSQNLLLETADSVNGLMSGTLSIGTLYTTIISGIVPRIIRDFTSAYSNIQIRLLEYALPAIPEQLQNGDIDIAFMAGPVPKGFEFLPLFEDVICLVMAKDHPFSQYDKVPIAKLSGCDFITPNAGWDDNLQLVSAKKSFTPHIRHYAASDAAGTVMAAEGLGVYIVSKLQAESSGIPVAIREFREDVSRTVGVAYRKTKYPSSILREFIHTVERNKDFIQAKVSAAMDQEKETRD